jgi:hypothetical protein
VILGISAGFIWFALFFSAHLAVIRCARIEARARINQRLFFAGLLGIVFSLWPTVVAAQGSTLARGGVAMAILCGALSYIGLFVLYMPFYYTVITSLSVRTMVMLRRRPDARMPIAELREEFVSRRLVGQWLATMVANGFLVLHGDSFALSPKGRSIAVIFNQKVLEAWAGG